VKKTMALAFALSFAALLAMVPGADAKGRRGGRRPGPAGVSGGGWWRAGLPLVGKQRWTVSHGGSTSVPCSLRGN
jgi:hypothetical protein